MRYETQRIINKNQKYERTKANAIIRKLKMKGLSTYKCVDAIKILLKDDNTESQKAILEKALSYLNLEQETNREQK